MRIVSSLGAALLACLCSGSLGAQFLYSRSLSYPGGRLAINLQLLPAQANTTFTVSVSSQPLLQIVAPATITSDASGFAAGNVEVQRLLVNSAPLSFTVTIAHPTLPGGQLQKRYWVRSSNGELGSAWPEVLMAQGAFCNPADSASAIIAVDRASDLDGDGVYGDLNSERTANGRDPLDFPNEFATDVNTSGTRACVTPSPLNLFVPGSSGRQVAFLADNRGQTAACTFTSKLNFAEDLVFARSFHGRPAVFVVSSDADEILLGRDQDGDGAVSQGEISVFFAPKLLVNNENYSPDGVAIDPTAAARVWWISDKSGATGSPINMGIIRLDDTNADGAIAAGEWRHSWTGMTLPVQVENQTIDHSEFEALHVDGQGGVLVNQTALGTIFRWVDANQNGVAETGEVKNWLTYNTASTLVQSVEFATNPNFPALTGPFWAMNLIESARNVMPGNREVYFVGWTNGTGIGAGSIFRCEDRNADGDVNDQNEVSYFVNPTFVVDPFPPNFVSGLDVAVLDENANGAAEDNELYVFAAEPNGPMPSCGFTNFVDLCLWRFADRNGDGDATDAGEAERIGVHPTGAFNRNLTLMPPAIDGGFAPTFYQRSAVMTVRHPGCVTPAGDTVRIDLRREKLEEGTQGTPFGGNTRFAVLTHGNGAGNPSVLVLSGSLLPSPLPFGACSFWLGFPFFADLIPPITADANGTARFDLPVPDPVRGTLFLQAANIQSGAIFLGEAAELRVH